MYKVIWRNPHKAFLEGVTVVLMAVLSSLVLFLLKSVDWFSAALFYEPSSRLGIFSDYAVPSAMTAAAETLVRSKPVFLYSFVWFLASFLLASLLLRLQWAAVVALLSALSPLVISLFLYSPTYDFAGQFLLLVLTVAVCWSLRFFPVSHPRKLNWLTRRISFQALVGALSLLMLLAILLRPSGVLPIALAIPLPFLLQARDISLSTRWLCGWTVIWLGIGVLLGGSVLDLAAVGVLVIILGLLRKYRGGVARILSAVLMLLPVAAFYASDSNNLGVRGLFKEGSVVVFTGNDLMTDLTSSRIPLLTPSPLNIPNDSFARLGPFVMDSLQSGNVVDFSQQSSIFRYLLLEFMQSPVESSFAVAMNQIEGLRDLFRPYLLFSAPTHPDVVNFVEILLALTVTATFAGVAILFFSRSDQNYQRRLALYFLWIVVLLGVFITLTNRPTQFAFVVPVALLLGAYAVGRALDFPQGPMFSLTTLLAVALYVTPQFRGFEYPTGAIRALVEDLYSPPLAPERLRSPQSYESVPRLADQVIWTPLGSLGGAAEASSRLKVSTLRLFFETGCLQSRTLVVTQISNLGFGPASRKFEWSSQYVKRREISSTYSFHQGNVEIASGVASLRQKTLDVPLIQLKGSLTSHLNPDSRAHPMSHFSLNPSRVTVAGPGAICLLGTEILADAKDNLSALEKLEPEIRGSSWGYLTPAMEVPAHPKQLPQCDAVGTFSRSERERETFKLSSERYSLSGIVIRDQGGTSSSYIPLGQHSPVRLERSLSTGADAGDPSLISGVLHGPILFFPVCEALLSSDPVTIFYKSLAGGSVLLFCTPSLEESDSHCNVRRILVVKPGTTQTLSLKPKDKLNSIQVYGVVNPDLTNNFISTIEITSIER